MQELKEKAIVSIDPEFEPRIPPDGFGIQAYINPDDHRVVDIFVAVAASAIAEHAENIRIAVNAKQFRILFLREDLPLEWLPEQILKAGLPMTRLLPKLLLYSNWKVPERVIKAWADDSQQVLIADAIAGKETLTVRNCALEIIELSFADTPVLSKIEKDDRTKFEIDDVGSFISWPAYDIDLDFDSFRYFTDPEWRKKCDSEQVLSQQGFGYAVKGVRELNNLTQIDIESRTGISERQLRRYETEGIRPRVSSLEKLAQAHGMELNAYLEELASVLNGPIAVIIPCDTTDQQTRMAARFAKNFTWLATEQGRPLPLYRRKGSKDYDIWTHDRRPDADQSMDQLALALRVESPEDFQAIKKFCRSNKITQDTALGMDRWPSVAYVPAATDYVLDKLTKRSAQ